MVSYDPFGTNPQPVRGIEAVIDGFNALVNPVTGEVIRYLDRVPDKGGAAGLSYEQQLALATAPRTSSSTSTSYGVSQSLQDPAALAIQRDQLAEQIRLNLATIAHLQEQDAMARQNAEYLREQNIWARKNGDAQLAQTAAYQSAQVDLQRQSLAEQIRQANQQAATAQQQLLQHAQEFNATQGLETDRFNAQQGLATEQANNQAEAQKRADLQRVNADIGTLAQDTGNRGKFAAFATASSPWSGANTAIGDGASLIDDASVGPLQQSLDTRQEISNQSDRPYSFKPIAFNPLPLPAAPGPLSAGGPTNVTWMPGNEQYQGLTPAQAAARAYSGPTSTAGEPVIDAGGLTPATVAALTGQQTPAAQQAAVQALQGQGYTPVQQGTLPAMENGGLVRGMFMAGDSSDGEENPEIVVPLGDGNTIVISTRGMAPEKVKAAKAKLQKFATGGLFSNLGDSTAKQFLTAASKKFREDTPWEGQDSALPSPVYASSPGFNPDLQALLSSGRALEQGIPVSYSNWLTDLFRPTGVGERVVGRTA